VAVSKETRPLLDALRPAPGLIRVLGLRLAVVLLSSLPAFIAAAAGVANGVAKRPIVARNSSRRTKPDSFVLNSPARVLNIAALSP